MSLKRSLPPRDAAYFERAKQQTFNWAMGLSRHNKIDDECCPDFSCCCPDLHEKDAVLRWQTYHDVYCTPRVRP